jgi:hypothetical protein
MHRCASTNRSVPGILRSASVHTKLLDLGACPSERGEGTAGLTRHGSMLNLPKADADWVAPGVNFSKCMEVYVFKK